MTVQASPVCNRQMPVQAQPMNIDISLPLTTMLTVTPPTLLMIQSDNHLSLMDRYDDVNYCPFKV